MADKNSMGWLKWPLLFCAVYGALWLRHHVMGGSLIASDDLGHPVRLGEPDEETAQKLLQFSKNEDPKSKKTLSYAFHKLSQTEREISSVQNNKTKDSNSLDLEKLLNLKHRPQELLTEAERQLAHLGSNELPERVILLREVISARNSDTLYQVEEIFEKERHWLAQEAASIDDTDALSGYIGELTRLSLMADAGKSTPLAIIQELSDTVSRNPEVFNSLRRAVKDYIPWEYQKWIQTLPPELQINEKTP
jgi:hypothetical protein